MPRPEFLIGRKTTCLLTLAGVVLGVAAAGCNNSRYGLTYDQRLPHIKRVAIVPAAIGVRSLHTGGVLESRPDLEPDVRARTVAAVAEVIRERGVDVEALPLPLGKGETDKVVAGQLALLNAVREAIITHHYEHGRSRFFEYPTGDAVAVFPGVGNAEGVLCISLAGVVPTAGRKVLQGTAIAIGILTGIHIHVSTNKAALVLMLVDADTGNVLWLNWHEATVDVRSERGLRRFVKRGCSYLLKPRK